MAKAKDFEGKNPDELFYVVEYSHEDAEKTGYSNYSYWGSVFQNFLKHRVAVLFAILFLVLTAFSFIALAIGKYDFATLKIDQSLRFIRPNSEYWFGTDDVGRDYWCQVWYAAQISIRLSLLVAIGESILGVVIGLIWGYVRSLDRFFTELYNLIDNIPMIIYMTLIALLVGHSFWIMVVSMIAIGWLNMARRVRNMVFMFRDREYNLASRCLGTPLWRVLTKNILPYLVSVIILRMALSIPSTISLESTMSYLGIGLDISTPSLGVLLAKTRSWFLDYPYLLAFPAAIVSIISISFYVVGNAFSDAADPRNHV
jgi:oligopeptide transport system permease protein